MSITDELKEKIIKWSYVIEWPCDNRSIFGTYFEMFWYQRQQPLNQKSQVSIYYITPFPFFILYSSLNFDVWSVIYPSSPSRRREAPCEGTNSPRLFTPGETKALAKSKVHQLSRAWPTILSGWSSSLISKIWRTVMNSGHWLVQFKVDIITTAWRQRNSKHFLIWWLINFLQIYFILLAFLLDFVNFRSFLRKKESAKRREPTLTKVTLF
jgi:hypothetical protein